MTPHDRSNLSAIRENTVMVIGNFDGVHKGHRSLFQAAQTVSMNTGKPISVLTFEPHPVQYFNPDCEPFRITPLDVKTRILDGLGVKYLMVSGFDDNMANMSADIFMRKMLVNANPHHVIVGDNFFFGKDKEGSSKMLKDNAYDLPFDVSVFAALLDDTGQAYSSTRIREHIRAGEMGKANALLDWNWEIEGLVQNGDKRGIELGFPTANLNLGEYIRPKFGIYAGKVLIPSEMGGESKADWRPAVANIGIRPMYPSDDPLVEIHIFDYNGNLYGKRLRFQPLHYLREEAKFDSEDTLIKAIKQDCDKARNLLKNG